MQRDVELGPEDLVQAGLGADALAVQEAGGGRVGEELVGAGADQGVGHPVARARPAGPAPRHSATSRSARGEEAAGGAERQAAFVARRRHRDPPALARLADHVLVGHEDLVQEELREGRLAVEAADRADRDARGAQIEHQVGQALVRFRPCPGRCGTGRTRGRRRPPARTRSSGRSAASRRPCGRPSTAARPGPNPPPAPTRPAPRSPRRSPSAAGPGPAAPRVPWSKRVGARRLMPFWPTRPGAPAA